MQPIPQGQTAVSQPTSVGPELHGDINKFMLVEKMFRAAFAEHTKKIPARRPPSCERISYSELPKALADDPFVLEWNTYVKNIGHWLAEGREGKHVLLKGEEIVGMFDTWDAARQAGLDRFLLEPFLVHQIRAEEPNLRVRGLNYPCPNSRLQ